MPRKKRKRQLLVVVACMVDPHPSDASVEAERRKQVGPRVLLARRKEEEQKEIHLMWELPGGKVDFGETAESALLREVQEETGYQVDIVGLVPFSYATEWEYEDFKQHTVIYCYECRVHQAVAQEASNDHKVEELRWFLFDEVDFSYVLPGSREFIWHVAEKHSISLEHYEPKTAYATFTRIEPSRNMNRFWSITLQIDPNAERPYLVTTRRRTLNQEGTGHPFIYEFSSHREACEEILRRLRDRRSHGYALNDFSGNFPFKDFLEGFSKSEGSVRQLPLPLAQEHESS